MSLCSYMNIVPVVTFYEVRDHYKVQMNGYIITIMYRIQIPSLIDSHLIGVFPFVFLRHLFCKFYVYQSCGFNIIAFSTGGDPSKEI